MSAILPQDMSELKRIATNTYEEEKRDQAINREMALERKKETDRGRQRAKERRESESENEWGCARNCSAPTGRRRSRTASRARRDRARRQRERRGRAEATEGR